ncbi:hypothetical protein HON58_05220, partial [Candidatus Peregrinibacteria bacterium]|nr:hypothetical protein [Candidatus Peregrinibacteria bacterium]
MAPKKEVPSIPAPEDPKPVKAPEKGEEQKAAEAIAAKEKRVKRYLDAM